MSCLRRDRHAQGDRRSRRGGAGRCGLAAGGDRRPPPAHLPRDEVRHEPAPVCPCPDCGGTTLRKRGDDVTEVLDYVPAAFRVIRHVRPRYACGRCDAPVQAPTPSLPIERGKPAPGLVAHVLFAKYGDHLPLHRQADIYAREGVEIGERVLR